MSARGPIPPDPGQSGPFDREPWPGEPGYQMPAPPEVPDLAPIEFAADPSAPGVDPPLAEPPIAQPPAEEPPGEPVFEVAPEEGVEAPYVEVEHAEGDLVIPTGYRTIEGIPIGGGRAVAIVVSRFNGEITSGLLNSALAELDRLGITSAQVTIVPVPGAFELPLAAMALAKSRRFACVVALGCVIRGETPHFEYIASETASGLQLAGIETGVPVAFGVLTVETKEQALARFDKGAQAARSGLEQADVFGKLRSAGA